MFSTGWGTRAMAVAFCLSGFLLMLQDPCGVCRVSYFPEMFVSFHQDNLFYPNPINNSRDITNCEK